MNMVILSGRLVRDPEIRYGSGAEPMCIAKFSLAVDKNYKKVDEATIIRYQGDLPEFVVEEVSAYENLGDLCILDDEEEAELQILWGEMQI